MANSILNVPNQLKQYFKTQNLSQSEIAEKLGTTQQVVSMYISGKRCFGKNAATKWYDAFGFRIGWLISGEEPMFEGDTIKNVNNNSVVGNIIINSPNTTVNKNPEDIRIYKELYEKEHQDNLNLRMKILKLMDKLSAAGISCEDC